MATAHLPRLGLELGRRRDWLRARRAHEIVWKEKFVRDRVATRVATRPHQGRPRETKGARSSRRRIWGCARGRGGGRRSCSGGRADAAGEKKKMGPALITPASLHVQNANQQGRLRVFILAASPNKYPIISTTRFGVGIREQPLRDSYGFCKYGPRTLLSLSTQRSLGRSNPLASTLLSLSFIPLHAIPNKSSSLPIPEGPRHRSAHARLQISRPSRVSKPGLVTATSIDVVSIHDHLLLNPSLGRAI
ncbi:hypothetical protein EXIGLDRAFT_499290 [Exidia glandulosa HHB12029]|uniref:Uncharacterized protein n=1 Tax=Exidia glandulosa HHB12029 TaxID=1314781 RepID=A0A165JGM8_EXIGL|nr:hypothetical protein EXIGLDRAFT_499290 [Exidia glandulosa HHB12029]